MIRNRLPVKLAPSFQLLYIPCGTMKWWKKYKKKKKTNEPNKKNVFVAQSHQCREMKSWDWQATAERSLAPPGVAEAKCLWVGGNWLTVQRQVWLSQKLWDEGAETQPPRGIDPAFLCDSAIFLPRGRRPQKTIINLAMDGGCREGWESMQTFQSGAREQTNKTESLLYKVSVNHSVVSDSLRPPEW